MKRWRGLAKLVTDAVDAGSSGVERVQLGLAKRTFDVLEALPVVAPPARVVHVAHDLSVRSVHGTIRLVNRGLAASLDIALDAVEEDRLRNAPPPEEPPASGATARAPAGPPGGPPAGPAAGDVG